MPGTANATQESRSVRLFRNGANQAVRIPRGFELPGTEAVMTREAGAIVIRPAPAPARSLLAVLKALKPLEESFPDIPELPAEPVDL
jgi:antitoxin VapB